MGYPAYGKLRLFVSPRCLSSVNVMQVVLTSINPLVLKLGFEILYALCLQFYHGSKHKLSWLALPGSRQSNCLTHLTITPTQLQRYT